MKRRYSVCSIRKTAFSGMIRSFQRRDLARLHELDQVCFSREIAYSKSELQYFLTHPRCSCWVAEQPATKLAGFVIIERSSRQGRQAGHIVTLDIDPAARRCGLGSLLMRTAEEQMKHEGAASNELGGGGEQPCRTPVLPQPGLCHQRENRKILWGEGRRRGDGEGDLMRCRKFLVEEELPAKSSNRHQCCLESQGKNHTARAS